MAWITVVRRAGGERNAQGAGVWKRVRLKLEGKDPDAGRRANHHEQVGILLYIFQAPLTEARWFQFITLMRSVQVEYIINEATSAENLCMMYEGWMSWVWGPLAMAPGAPCPPPRLRLSARAPRRHDDDRPTRSALIQPVEATTARS